MTPIDSLKVGDFITIVARKQAAEVDCWGNRREYKFDGIPVEVMEISLPFIAIANHDHIGTVDVRLWEVQRVTKKYAELFLAEDRERATQTTFQKKKHKKPKPDKSLCFRCGSKIIQKLSKEREWRCVCCDCGFDFGLAPKGIV